MAECVYEDLLPLPLMVCIMGWHITGKKTKEELLSNLKLGKVEYVIFTSGNDPLHFDRSQSLLGWSMDCVSPIT